MVAIALSFLAIKINIALEISINSLSSTDRGDRTSDFKTLSEFYKCNQLYLKVTFHFKLADQLLYNSGNPERKSEIHLRGSGEIAKRKKDWKKLKSK